MLNQMLLQRTYVIGVTDWMIDERLLTDCLMRKLAERLSGTIFLFSGFWLRSRLVRCLLSDRLSIQTSLLSAL
jgi:hypothetical protein